MMTMSGSSCTAISMASMPSAAGAVPWRGRSPGSALKPFLYAIAFDEGVAAPETLVRDAPRSWTPPT